MSGGKISSEEKMKAVERLKAEEYNTVGPNLYKFYKKYKNTICLPRKNMLMLLKMPKNRISFETIITVYYHFTTCEKP